jgi:DNA modification methylase
VIDLRQGDCLEVLRRMRSRSVHCCVTSPPYFGLRDYGVDGQIGLEPTPSAFVAKMVAVFGEVRRVLRDDGTLWLNLGDSYAQSQTGRTRNGHGNISSPCKLAVESPGRGSCGLATKQLLGIPWRVAFALQADGWYLRSDIIWHKPNPMPESVRDRPTKAHEYLFLLAKSERYYYDSGAIRETTPPVTPRQFGRKIAAAHGLAMLTGNMAPGVRWQSDGGRNRRSVWTVTPKPFKGAHFATFPPKLVEPCILAGSPVGGIVLDPFSGAGTTGVVAAQHGRSYRGIELNPEYLAMSRERIKAALKAVA